MVFCFSNASHDVIVFMTNNSLPSEKIHDSHHSGNTRPWGIPFPPLCCYPISQKQPGPPCVDHICTRCYQSGCMPSPSVWPGYTYPRYLCQISCQHIPLALLLIQMQCLRYFLGAGGERRGAFLATALPESELRCCTELVKNGFLLQIEIGIWINLQQYQRVERREQDIKA